MRCWRRERIWIDILIRRLEPGGHERQRRKRIRMRCLRRTTGALESETCIQLNLTPCGDRRKYSADVTGQVPRHIFEHGVSIPSQGERTLRVAWDCKIGMVDEVISFHTERKLLAFRQVEVLLHREIELREAGATQDIASSTAELAGRRPYPGTRIKPARGSTHSRAV